MDITVDVIKQVKFIVKRVSVKYLYRNPVKSHPPPGQKPGLQLRVTFPIEKPITTSAIQVPLT